MSANVIDLHEWAERRARRQALEHLRQWGWLPSGIEAMISLMYLPAGEKGETIATKVRNELVDLFIQAQVDMGVAPVDVSDMDPEQWAAVRQRVDELFDEQATGTEGTR